MCTFSKPLDEPAPSYDHTTGIIKCHMAATYGLCSIVMDSIVIIVWFVREVRWLDSAILIVVKALVKELICLVSITNFCVRPL